MNSPWVVCVVGQGWGRDDENVSLGQSHYFALPLKKEGLDCIK